MYGPVVIMETQSIYLLNLFLSAFMCGVVWLVQILIYPSFNLAKNKEHHQFHMTAISKVVLPIMLLELGAIIYFYFTTNSSIILLVLILLILIWLSTFMLQVPHHRAVQSNPSTGSIAKLVSFNWIRTCLWTAKTLLLLWYGIA